MPRSGQLLQMSHAVIWIHCWTHPSRAADTSGAFGECLWIDRAVRAA